MGENHQDHATALNTLANIYFRTGRLKEADTVFREVVRLFKVNKGENNYGYAYSLNNYAKLLMNMRNYTEAEKKSLEALRILKSLPENHDEQITNIYNFLTVLNYNQHQHVEALKYARLDSALSQEKSCGGNVVFQQRFDKVGI